MKSYDRIRLCTERDLCDRARNHLYTFTQYYQNGGDKIPHELDEALEWLHNYLYKVEMALRGYHETQNP